jgi:type II secretory pathway pseudopilin PulG
MGRRIGWIVLETGLILVIVGLVIATILPVFFGPSRNADRFEPHRTRQPATAR